MAFNKRTWVGRLGEGLNKYIIGALGLDGKQTITSAPDNVTQEGDALSASNLNDLETRIDNEFTNVNTEIDKLKDGTTVAKKAECDEDGNNIKATYAEKENYVPKADIVDGLSSSDTTKVLSAKQGKALNDGKANRPSSPVNGDIPKLDGNGDLVDSGIPASNVAQQDGYYEGLTAGNAEQLIASVFENDKTPYNFRTSGGSLNIGDREYKRGIVGGTFGVNQLALNISSDNWVALSNTTATFTSGKIVFTSAQYYGGVKTANSATKLKVVSGHTYLLRFYSNLDSNLIVSTNDGTLSISGVTATVTQVGNKYLWERIQTVSFDETSSVYVWDTRHSDWTEVVAEDIQIIDLTLWFGSTIADYIYTLETGNAGAGVAWFRKLFPKLRYAYNVGSLESVCVGEHNNIGFNQVDIATDYDSADCSLTGSTLQNIKTDTGSELQIWIQIYRNDNTLVGTAKINDIASNGRKIITFYSYEGDKIIFKHNGVTHDIIFFRKNEHVLHNTFYCISFTVEGYNPTVAGGIKLSDINLNFHWDGERDGEYEPYVKHSYPLDHTKTLRGIPKLDGNNKLYYDGDVYKSDGVITRKVGKKTYNVPSEVTAFSDSYTNVVFYLIPKPSDSTFYNDDILGNGLASKFELLRTVPTLDSTDSVGKILCGYSLTHFFVGFVAGTTLAQAQEALSTLSLIYELATPTTEEATPYTELQIVDDFGTEEFVDYPESQGTRDVAIPVGHVTDYQPNLRAKLEMAPNNPDGDGKYLLQMDSGEASYVAYTDPDSRLDDLEDKVPAPPTTAGTYVLKVTVADGEDPDYEWVSES